MKPSREPVSPTVEGQDFEGRSAAIAEDIDGAGEGIALQLLTAKRH